MNLSIKQCQELLSLLQNRFEKHVDRHPHLEWGQVQAKINEHPQKIWSLYEMERTGGEPDVLDYHDKTREYIFYDCSPESPHGRRSLCYDNQALETRKANKPQGSAISMALAMGVDILNEEDYRVLQQFGEFDKKTSSWVKTPDNIRERGGALFGDCRYGRVFIYHNGVESYYAARGFRALLRI